MRKLATLAVVSVAVFLAVAPPVTAVTMSAWATTPITVGDKVFTLISTTWAANDNFTVSSSSGYHFCDLSPASSVLTNTTKTLIYKVTIIDDPGTSPDEAVLMYIAEVSADGSRYIASGTFTMTGVFDDDSDFSSPLATFSNDATPTGVLSIAGTVKELYVKLTATATGSTLLTDHAIAYKQLENPVPTEPSTWGKIKALYR